MHPANSQNSTSYYERSKGGGVVFSFPTTNIWDIYIRWAILAIFVTLCVTQSRKGNYRYIRHTPQLFPSHSSFSKVVPIHPLNLKPYLKSIYIKLSNL